MTGLEPSHRFIPDPLEAACLRRTRSAVLNVLVAIGAGIAVSGLVLRQFDRGAMLWPDRSAETAMVFALVGLIFASLAVRRTIASRTALRDPERRAARFYRGHVLSALVGALAIPLGFAYGWAVRPRLDGIGPFWVVALALSLLALPRDAALEGFDRPMADPSPAESSPGP